MHGDSDLSSSLAGQCSKPWAVPLGQLSFTEQYRPRERTASSQTRPIMSRGEPRVGADRLTGQGDR